MTEIEILKYKEIINSLLFNESIVTNNLYINNCEIEITYHKYLCNIKDFNKYFVNKITKENYKNLESVYPGVYINISIINNDIISYITNGNLILKIYDEIYLVNIQNLLNRAISDNVFDAFNLFSSRDGLIESIETNISLIQKRVKSSNLIINTYKIGKRSKTEVKIMYINDIASKNNIKKIKNILSTINTDSILSSTDIYYHFTKNSIFPLALETGSPEIVATNLYSGKIAILIENIPVALLLPTTLFSLMLFTESKKANPTITIYSRVLISIMLFLSIFFLGLYAALITYHSKNLSLVMISEIKTSLKGNTSPLFIEFILLIFLFDLLRMATCRSPKITLQNVLGTVGGLLIGQNAVNSGFISSFNLVIAAICYISTYAITSNQRLITAFSLLRLFVLLSGLLLGLYGVLISSIIIINYLANKKSLSVDYLAPLSPIFKKDLFILGFSDKFFKKKYRNNYSDIIDKTKGN